MFVFLWGLQKSSSSSLSSDGTVSATSRNLTHRFTVPFLTGLSPSSTLLSSNLLSLFFSFASLFPISFTSRTPLLLVSLSPLKQCFDVAIGVRCFSWGLLLSFPRRNMTKSSVFIPVCGEGDGEAMSGSLGFEEVQNWNCLRTCGGALVR